MEQKNRTQYRIKIEDEQILNHTYAEEEALFQFVREGNVEGLKKMSHDVILKHPLVIEHDIKKNEEYMAVSGLSAIARLAIECGITSSESFLVSDIYLKKIALSKDLKEIDAISKEFYLAYTELIRDHIEKRSMNIYVEDCKKDIKKNLFKAISLSDIAKDLGIQPAYLSRLFSEHEGMTVTDYIHEQKLEVAKNMLMYSDRTIAEIADYLKFNSQSYFGKLFKKSTGMTPLTYRKMHHPPEF